MSMYLMSDYLSTATAGYAYTLNVEVQGEPIINMSKNQKTYLTDAGVPVTVTISNNIQYLVSLRWDALEVTDAKTIADLWSSSSKANGEEISFRWYNPVDTKTYVVNFSGKPMLKCITPSYQGVEEVTFLVRGNYVP